MMDKWQLHRAGLYNFWYYDNEILEFEDGKLLLRGANGSGKSVTMQSLLPVLLDGRKSPDRLDPFGSKSRKMTDYLLGEKEVTNREERTGYLFLEYKKENQTQYMTTGIGMQAKRNQNLKNWGFVITDNRRLGIDMNVFKKAGTVGQQEEYPLSKRELEFAIGEGGHVVETNKEYMELVNNYIFGFDTLEAFDDLIKLLLQLRSPKLSKDFRPTVVYEILEEALPPLTEEDLRHLSESIEQMDQTKQQLEQLEKEVHALERLNRSYDAYYFCILYDQALGRQKSIRRREEKKTALNEAEEVLVLKQSNLKKSCDKKEKLELEKITLQGQKQRLEQHNVFRQEEELLEEKKAYQLLLKDMEKEKERLDGKEARERVIQNNLSLWRAKAAQISDSIDEKLEDLNYEAEESSFSSHADHVKDYEKSRQSFLFDFWKQKIADHMQLLEKALHTMQKKEKLVSQFQEKNNQLSHQEKLRDDLNREEKQWKKTVNEDRQKAIESIHQWVNSNSIFLFSAESIQAMMRLVDDVHESVEPEAVRDLFYPEVERVQTECRNHIAQSQAELRRLKELENEREKEYAAVKNQQDPKPLRKKETVEARQSITKAAAPLYEVVEFIDGIPEELQVKIESVLLETGFLDALITKDIVFQANDRLLKAAPKMFVPTLRDFLQPDTKQKKVDIEYVDEILRSIEMDQTSPVHLLSEGSYRLGVLYGEAVTVGKVRFIGREARKRYRLELLAALEQEIAQMQTEQNRITEIITANDQQLAVIDRNWRAFPAMKNIWEGIKQLEAVREKKQMREEEITSIAEVLKSLDQSLRSVKRKLVEDTEGIQLENSTAAYSRALQMIRLYEKDMAYVENQALEWNNLLTHIEMNESHLTHIIEEIDTDKGELAVIDTKVKKSAHKIEAIEEELKLSGAEDIRRKIQHVYQKYQQTKQQLEEEAYYIPSLKEQIKQKKETRKVKEQEYQFWVKLASAWQQSLEIIWKEIKDEPMTEDRVRDIVKNKPSKEKAKLEGSVTTVFFEVKPDLTEHQMIQFTKEASVPDWQNELTEDESPLVEQWRTQSMRNVIEFERMGKKSAPLLVYQELMDEFSMQENQLDEMDKKLYEEILLHSVGHKLRAKIRRAEKWTQEMKQLMETPNISSGITFSIRWKPKTAEKEEELDTADLVRLLKQDAALLTEEDMQHITDHFRSKIETAKASVDGDEDVTLLQVLKKVLDYRKWFSFVLYFERPKETRRELTNHHFFKFSGGEKALAMYIPLFTACYSRYNEASPSAPYIITLDEAFAGVDENNIKEAFEVVEKLGFNYIMNSQVLWGDYETVSSLAIYELFRPKGADFVSAIRYVWDGNKRILDEASLAEKSVYE